MSSGEDARARFADLITQPEARIDLAEATLWIAAEEYPRLDVPGYLGRLDELAGRARLAVAAARRPDQALAALSEYLFRDEGFPGNSDKYYDLARARSKELT